MSNFELWIKDCEEKGTIVMRLEGRGDTALYKVTQQVEVRNFYYFTTPVYVGWVHGRMVCFYGDYRSAYGCWTNLIRYEELREQEREQ